MKRNLRSVILFVSIMLVLNGLVWLRYQNLFNTHMELRQATFNSTLDGIVNTFGLVSQTIAEELLLQDDITSLVHEIVTTQGDRRNRARGLLYRRLDPLYQRISRHSIRQLHFHYPDGRSMLRFHLPGKADDDLLPFRTSVRLANRERRQVHGYESGKVIHGFRHVYPLSYEGRDIGTVEVSNSFKQIYQELIEHVTADSQYHFIMLKSDFWHKLAAGQKEFYHPSVLSSDYMCENGQIHQYGSRKELLLIEDELRGFFSKIAETNNLKEGIKTKQDFALATTWDNASYSVLFRSVKNIKNEHAAYILSIHPEPYLHALKKNRMIQFMVALGFASFIVFFQRKLSRTREQQQRTNEFLQTLTEHMGQGLYTTDSKGMLTHINQEASRILGYTPEECMDKDAHELFHINDPQHQDQGCPILGAILNDETCEQQKSSFRLKDGRQIPVELTCTPLKEMNKIVGTITLFHDISIRDRHERELKDTQQRLEKANRHLTKLAHIDGLTSLANRRLFDQTLAMLWKVNARKKTPLALLMIDIDYFKAYNDYYGHLQGDDCLQNVAAIIRKACFRPDDFVARYGGEEFSVLLPDTNLEDATQVAKRISTNLAQKNLVHNASPLGQRITVSIGVCSFIPESEANQQTLIDCADNSLYAAKQEGRNRICARENFVI